MSKNFIDMSGARELARALITERRTCQGCWALQVYPRGMCRAEASAHYRTPREAYQSRCDAYAVRAAAEPDPVAEAATTTIIAYARRVQA